MNRVHVIRASAPAVNPPSADRATRSVPRVAALACLLAATLAAGGCAFWRGSKRTLPELPAVAGGLAVRPAWTVAVGRGGIGFAPVVVGNALWAASGDGNVVRVDAASGRLLWRVALGRPLSAGVGSDGRTAVVVTREGEAIALDEDGRERWRASVGVDVATVPSVALDTVLFRGTDNRVVALDLDTGRRRWVAQRPNPPLVLRQTAAIAVSPEAAYVGMPGGRLAAIALDTGAPRWEIAVALPRGTTEIERIADVTGSPLVSGREVCAATYQGRIGCFDVATGTQVWARPFSTASGIEVDSRFVFAADADSAVHAFSRTGASVWKQDRLAQRELSAPLSIGRAVAFGDRTGLVHFLSREDGAILARVPTDGSPIVAPPLSAGSIVIVQTRNGNLHAFQAAE